MLFLVKQVEHEFFAQEIDYLKSNPKWLLNLSPFLDPGHMLRLGGKLKTSNFIWMKNIPPSYPENILTELIIFQIHTKFHHPGLNTTMYMVLQHFWIYSVKRSISSYLSRCQRFFRLNPKKFQPIMADLPKYRVSQLKPFGKVGTDFGRPFLITHRRQRGAKSYKIYICIFVCH